LRSVSDEHPIFSAIDEIAAHCDGCSRSCANTSLTARSRTSGEYRLVLFITPSSHVMESPEIPGRFRGANEDVVVDLTVEQVAKKLNRSPSTVRNWLAAGDIPGAYRLKRREWRIPPSALEWFLDKQRTAPQATATTVGARALALDEWRKHLPNEEEE
jgi:excisionase family DNA binding protein